MMLRKKNKTTAGHTKKTPMPTTIDWDRPAMLATEPGWLWRAVPAFVGTNVTIVRPTHANFLESYRRFGVPTADASRLENHSPLSGSGTDWRVRLLAVGGRLGVARYIVCSASNTNRMLATVDVNSNGGTVQVVDGLNPTTNEERVAWYLVPRTGMSGRGWDIVHAWSGLRLVSASNGTAVRLTTLVHPTDYWDILRVVPNDRTQDRPHFWMPEFFAHCFGSRWPEDPYPASNLYAVAGDVFVNAALNGTGSDDRTTAIAGSGSNITVLTINDRSNWSRYTGASVVVAINTSPTEDRTTERERRAYQDRVNRTDVGGTGEYVTSIWPHSGASAYTTVFLRITPTSNASAAYADCLVRFGMDSPVCRAMVPSGDAGYAVSSNSVALPALCTGRRLWSTTCDDFCADPRSRTSRVCVPALQQLCAPQTAPNLNDPMCACFLTDDTYQRAKRQAIDATDLAPNLRDALVLTLANQGECGYYPCNQQRNRIDSNCSDNAIQVCLNTITNSTINATRFNNNQSCVNVANSDGKTADALNALPAAGSGSNPIIETIQNLNTEQVRTLTVGGILAGGIMLMFL